MNKKLFSNLFLLLLFCLLSLAVISAAKDEKNQKDVPSSHRHRRTKELEEKINKLDDGTKQRIYAMKATGMPKEAIAEKIAYAAGGKSNAKRIVDAIHDEPAKRPGNKAKSAPSATFAANTNKNANSNSRPASSNSNNIKVAPKAKPAASNKPGAQGFFANTFKKPSAAAANTPRRGL